MKKGLMPNWDLRPVSAVADVNPRPPLPHDVRRLPYYGMAAIDETTGELREPEMVEVDGAHSGKSKFQSGDVLFARIAPCVQNRKSALAQGIPGDFALGSNEFYVLRPRKCVSAEYLFYLLRQQKIVDAAVTSFTGTSGRQRVPRSFWDALTIPLPPLPVQQRIVQILQKADEIRRKRREALELADKILPALFLDMFGDPATNPKGRPMVSFDQALVDVTRECNKVQQHTYRGVTSGKWPVIDQGEAYIGGYTNDDALVYRGELPVIIFGDHTRRFKFVDFPFVLGADGAKVLRATSRFCPEYLYGHLQLLRIPNRGYERHFKFLRELHLMKARPKEQEYFATVFHTYREKQLTLSTACVTAANTFESLLSRAFTGELTADWEAANAEWIAEQQALYERLSRLVVLALLVERVKQARRAAAETLVTALMKYVFLLQMEGSADRRRLYHFIPYHYGPFAKELYSDLETLKNEGLVRVQHDGEEGKTRITLVDSSKAEEVLASLPEDLKQDVAAIVKRYGDLDHNALLKAVYEKYPAYARRSRLRRKR